MATNNRRWRPSGDKPAVALRGTEITPYLYGTSARILPGTASWAQLPLGDEEEYKGPADKNLDIEDLRKIAQQLVKQKSRSCYGMLLLPVFKTKVGEHLMELTVHATCILKRVLLVTRIEDGKVYADCVYPKWEAQRGQSFSVEDMIRFDPQGSDNSDAKAYFRMVGNWGEVPLRKPKLYEFVATKGGALRALIECWTLVHNKDLHHDTASKYRKSEEYWLDHFDTPSNFNLCHRTIHTVVVSRVLRKGNMEGINELYDTRELHKCDYITPLLLQMQHDILHQLLKSPEIIPFVFYSRRPWPRKMQAIEALFDRYEYGIEFCPSLMTLTHISRARRLELAERILRDIVRHSPHPGDAEDARKVFKIIVEKANEELLA